ncbi:MAG: iron ABC transporter permease [Propionivibrio sp.]|nr:iron ABC transporter permease [Propionivibrio sp.]
MAFALALLPWHQQEAGFFAGRWMSADWTAKKDAASALYLMLKHGAGVLWPLVGLGVVALGALFAPLPRALRGLLMLGCGAGGLAWLLVLGFAPEWLGLGKQVGLGYGAMLVAAAFLFLLTGGAALLGACRGDMFVTGMIGLIIALISLFVIMPVGHVLAKAFVDPQGATSVPALLARMIDQRVWGLNCLAGGRCGVAWNTLYLGATTALTCTLLGLCFALVVTRTDFRWKRSLRALTLLPIITPPFVIGLALILLLGRNGALTQFVASWLGIPPGRWVYGFFGVWLSQVLAYTPIAFMVLIGVVEGVSPSVEEASQTLGASRWQTMRRVSLPLMKPGLANAFLVTFIESMADFGNPMVLGGSYSVLSTEIYFAIVGAQTDEGRAASLGLILLCFSMAAFLIQRLWLGRKSYATVTGKADNGQHVGLSPKFARLITGIVVVWTTFTIVIYGMVLTGGFVKQWGRDNSFTLKHYLNAFGVDIGAHGVHWTGTAWSSFFTSMTIAGIAAPLTAALGMMTAWLLVRQKFALKGAFEFGTMMCFAVPGTVIGISYILAFNVPPIELTGTGLILILCFVFRNMPTGLRGGVAAMSQLDKSLDEASTMLRANSFTTARRIIFPLLKPAITTALVYSFVRSITSISAVIFLVSAKYDMATSYIIGLVENGQYGTAIAYSSMLIVVMLSCVLGVQKLVGARRLRRQDRVLNDLRTPPVLQKESA